MTSKPKRRIMKVSRQNRGVLLLTPPTTQFMIVGKAPFTRIRPICLDSGGIKTREGRFAMEKPCEICGKPITGKPGYVRRRRFCSRSCAAKSRTGPKNSNWKGGLVSLVCEACGKPFEVKQKTARREGYGRFCSKDCFYTHKQTLTGSSSNRWQGGPITLSCHQCGKSYQVPQYRESISRFCSLHCHDLFRIVPDAHRYPNAFRTLRESICERDSYACALCGKDGNTVHHIDYNKRNNDPANLITLCNRCHSGTNVSKRAYWTALFLSIMEGKPCQNFVQLKML